LKPTGPPLSWWENSRWNDTQIPTCSLVAEAASDHFDLIDSMWYPLKNRYMSFKRHNKATSTRSLCWCWHRGQPPPSGKPPRCPSYFGQIACLKSRPRPRGSPSPFKRACDDTFVPTLRSPLKAIEELVVNGYDAGAAECRLFVPGPADNDHEFIVVFDMVAEWMRRDSLTYGILVTAESAKLRLKLDWRASRLASLESATCDIHDRSQIDLRVEERRTILSVSLDFSEFTPNPEGPQKPITLPIRTVAIRR